MMLSDMLTAINSQVDDVVTPTDAVRWLNAAKDDMATAVEAKFPDLVSSNSNDTFVFDTKYHETAVIYASARFKEHDVMLDEARNLMAQYMSKRKDFETFYDVPPQYKDDAFSQQFTATLGQTIFSITKSSYNYRTSNPTVYYKNILQDNTLYSVNADKTITWSGTSLLAGDLITVLWEERAELAEPPYPWMASW